MPRTDAQVLFEEYGPLIDYSLESVSFFLFWSRFRLTNEHAHFQKRNQKLAHSPPSHLLPQLTSSCCRYASYYDVIFWKLRKRANLRKNDTLQDSKEYWTIEFFSKFQQEQQQWAYLHDYNNTALQKHKKGGSWKHEASSMRAQKGIMKVSWSPFALLMRLHNIAPMTVFDAKENSSGNPSSKG